eukprot:2617777-Pleurochrysis_carterae.AAC.1
MARLITLGIHVCNLAVLPSPACYEPIEEICFGAVDRAGDSSLQLDASRPDPISVASVKKHGADAAALSQRHAAQSHLQPDQARQT